MILAISIITKMTSRSHIIRFDAIKKMPLITIVSDATINDTTTPFRRVATIKTRPIMTSNNIIIKPSVLSLRPATIVVKLVELSMNEVLYRLIYTPLQRDK